MPLRCSPRSGRQRSAHGRCVPGYLGQMSHRQPASPPSRLLPSSQGSGFTAVSDFLSLPTETCLAHRFKTTSPRPWMFSAPSPSPCSSLPFPVPTPSLFSLCTQTSALSAVNWLSPRSPVPSHLATMTTVTFSWRPPRSHALSPTQRRSLPSTAPSPSLSQELSALFFRLEVGPGPSSKSDQDALPVKVFNS